jgi:hypothetical protein
VYALHLTLIGACLIALYRYQQQQTDFRLATFFAIYALAFGNHLSMILLLVPFALFVIAVRRDLQDLVRPRVLMLAIGIPLCAALLYAPNFVFVWTNIDAPASWPDRVATFWFDVTKADWRGTMVGAVDRSELFERVAMWLWDARMQFGAAGLVAATAGAIRWWTVSMPWALLLWTAYVINTVFALTYNVGDPHVFFLPGHLFTVLAMTSLFVRSQTRPGDAMKIQVPRALAESLAAVVLIGYAGWRVWDTWPSVDRHADRRADALVAQLAANVDDSHAILLSDMNWQAENALLYSARYQRTHLAWRRLPEVLPHLPFLVDDNAGIQRSVILAGRAAERVVSAYGPLFTIVPDGVPVPNLRERADRVPRGTPYVLTLLEPTSDEPLDTANFDDALIALAGPGARRTAARFQVWAGLTGESAAFHEESDRPFRRDFALLGDRFSVRMESWLPFETFRRSGFGHVFRGRQRLLTLERGVSLAWFNPDGDPLVAYAAGLYAPRTRFRIQASIPQQVARAADAILENSAAIERRDAP